MRVLLLSAAILATSLLLVPSGAASETWGCHTYEIYAGDRTTGAGASPDDASAAVAAGGHYVVYDGPPNDRFLYSFGLGTEMNGAEGWQRYDHYCDDTNDGEYEGECFLSCTF